MADKVRAKEVVRQYSEFKHSEAGTTRQKLNDLSEFVSELKRQQIELSKDNSDIDKRIDTILHTVEFDTFDVVTGYKVLRVIQELRKERRIIKAKRAAIDNVVQALDSGKVLNVCNKAIVRINDAELYINDDEAV